MKSDYLIFKDICDRLIALTLFILLLPVLIIIATFVFFIIGKPIIFKQKRPGLNGKNFIIYKFRTMKSTTDKEGNLLDDIDRKTKFGNILRSYSIDELLELLNVIKGEMSFVGPRPLLIEYIPLYSKEQFRRHNMKPGITGFAQVNGRNLISWQKKFELDIYYIDNVNFLLDIKIIIKTIWKIIRKEGINRKNNLPVIKFKGN